MSEQENQSPLVDYDSAKEDHELISDGELDDQSEKS